MYGLIIMTIGPEHKLTKGPYTRTGLGLRLALGQVIYMYHVLSVSYIDYFGM